MKKQMESLKDPDVMFHVSEQHTTEEENEDEDNEEVGMEAMKQLHRQWARDSSIQLPLEKCLGRFQPGEDCMLGQAGSFTSAGNNFGLRLLLEWSRIVRGSTIRSNLDIEVLGIVISRIWVTVQNAKIYQ
jgi:hypothetical protein